VDGGLAEISLALAWTLPSGRNDTPVTLLECPLSSATNSAGLKGSTLLNSLAVWKKERTGMSCGTASGLSAQESFTPER
jgi:hypothetical protein